MYQRQFVKQFLSAAITLTLGLAAQSAYAQGDTGGVQSQDIANVSLDDLLNAEVTVASKTARTLRDALRSAFWL